VTKWTYGEEGEAFPVQEGQTWEVGNHLLHCSDLMASSTFQQLVDRELGRATGPAVLYSDPPWGQGNTNAFRTKAGKDKATYTWQDLYHRICAIARRTRMPIWLEASVIESRDGQKLPSILRGYGERQAYVEIVYYRDKPCGLFYVGQEDAPPALLQQLRGQDDDHTPGTVLSWYAQGGIGTVIDPCAGQGATAREAEKLGWRSLTNELHPNRMSCSLFRLQKQIGEQPRLVG
jgi:hypothetical protein